jgi:hypothetical protein
MNGPEFFMKYAGSKLVPPDKLTGDPVNDANTVLTTSLPLHTGKSLRLSSCWMVITPGGVTTSFKAHPSTGFDTSASVSRADAINAALKSGEPCMLLALGKRTMTARDLFVSYDARAARLCSEGEVKTYDATKGKTWTS